MIAHSTSTHATKIYRAEMAETECKVTQGGGDMFEVRVQITSGSQLQFMPMRLSDAKLLWHCLDRMAEEEKWVHE